MTFLHCTEDMPTDIVTIQAVQKAQHAPQAPFSQTAASSLIPYHIEWRRHKLGLMPNVWFVFLWYGSIYILQSSKTIQSQIW